LNLFVQFYAAGNHLDIADGSFREHEVDCSFLSIYLKNMSKKWLIKDKNSINEELIKNNSDLNPIVLRLLTNRGLSEKQITKFLEPDYKENLHNPFLFKDMKPVVELINKHLQNGSKIVVYGDYDADGITASAVMFKMLEFLGCRNLDVYLPDRVTEGYGLNKEAIKKLADEKTNLVITVDNAIRNVEEVAYAKELGMDIIITDHHDAPDELPDCLIINPKVEGCGYPFQGLAGVGVAFKVAQALLTSPLTPLLKKEESRGEVFLKWLLDLVAIGTIADLVPLIDENRVLVKYGLVVLNKTQRVGLQKLIEVAQSGVDSKGNIREIDAWQVGFQLAPRLNAAGRLEHANNAYWLLTTEDEQEAGKIAEQLNSTNQERQKITEDIFEKADSAFIEAMAGKCDDKIIFAVWPGLTSSPAPLFGKEGGVRDENVWPSGVMGLVAGKLTEKYYRPALAITDKMGEIVGSGRSVPEFNVTEMLEKCAEYLSAFGGHKQACGFTVKPGRLDEFLVKAKKIAEKKLKGIELAPTLEINLKVDFKDVNEELYEALQKLRPFGVANLQPKFLSSNLQAINIVNMGNEQQHLKLKLSGGGKMFDAVAFFAPEEWKEIKAGDKINLVYYIDMNEWNGSRSVQLKIIDIKN